LGATFCGAASFWPASTTTTTAEEAEAEAEAEAEIEEEGGEGGADGGFAEDILL